MYPQTHFLFPFFVGVILVKLGWFSWELALIAGLAGVLIDVDHYVEHIFRSKKKRFSLRHTWRTSVVTHKFHQRSFIHHKNGAVVVTFLLIILAVFSQVWSLALALAFYSHMLLDHIHLKHPKRIKIKLFGIYEKEPRCELILDVLLLIGIVLVMI